MANMVPKNKVAETDEFLLSVASTIAKDSKNNSLSPLA